jgi:predicted nucleic acid-binding protein
VITLGEILKGGTILPDGKRRDQIQYWPENTLRPWFEGRVLPVDVAIAEWWGILAGQCHLKGTPLNMTDGLIKEICA